MAARDPFAPRSGVSLRPFTTLGVGGSARWYSRAARCEDVAAMHRWCAERDVPVLVLGGGSNVVISDEGFHGLAVHMAIAGITVADGVDATRVSAGAGESWDRVVESAVARGLAGIECLSGIPGTVGGTPIQNVGAYGQEVATVVERVVVFDRQHAEFAELPASDCGFSYRTSRFKTTDAGRFIVCGVSFRLTPGVFTATYPDLVTELERRGIVRPGPADLRDAVLTIRRRKGMVLDVGDADSRSVGSFFMNPVVTVDDGERIARLAGAPLPGFPAREGRVKISAAWLIERAGLYKGYGEGAVGLSTKHPLAIVNRGGATARDVVGFAVHVKRAVIDWCGVWLRPEPVFVGLDENDDVMFLQKGSG